MKTGTKKPKRAPLERDWLPAEVDFSKGKRGVTAKRYRQGTNLVPLAPDVAAAFSTTEAVNEALRSVVSASRLVRHPRRRAG